MIYANEFKLGNKVGIFRNKHLLSFLDVMISLKDLQMLSCYALETTVIAVRHYLLTFSE